MTVAASFPAGATIQRVEPPADQFTIVSNGFSRDERLSFFAVGLGLWLLSHRAGWEITASGIARQRGIGRDQVRRALVELEHFRYLRRVRQRDESGHLGAMLYLIRCTPFPDDEEENPRSDLRLNGQSLGGQSRAGAHHKKTSPKDNITQKNTPSGGRSASPPPPEERQEEPMPRTAPQPDALPLDIPEPPQSIALVAPRQAGKTTASKSAATVVAAYVDAYRRHHSGGDPLKSHKGRVARDAAQMLHSGQAGPDELVKAATAMGAGQWANLGQQVAIQRQKPGTRTLGPAPVAAPGSFTAGAEAARQKFYVKLRNDPELVRWVAEDPEETRKLLEREPSLIPYFQAVGAA